MEFIPPETVRYLSQLVVIGLPPWLWLAIFGMSSGIGALIAYLLTAKNRGSNWYKIAAIGLLVLTISCFYVGSMAWVISGLKYPIDPSDFLALISANKSMVQIN